MKKTNIIAIAAALVAVIAVTGIAASTLAADDNATTTNNFPFMERMGRFADHFDNLTDEEKAALEAQREEKEAEREAQRTAVEAALDSGSYSDWVAAVGEDAPILDKVNEDNFARFVEAHKLMQEARTIMEDELGIEGPGFGPGCGHGGMMHGGMHEHTDTDNS